MVKIKFYVADVLNMALFGMTAKEWRDAVFRLGQTILG